MIATIDDTHHALWLRIMHDGAVIRGVASGFDRHPATPCNDAHAGLLALEGMPLTGEGRGFSDRLPAATNCTHLADLARWSLSALRESVAPREIIYDIRIPDQARGPRWIDIARDGKVLHRWLVEDDRIVAPKDLAGQPLLRGFMAWARTTLDPDKLETAVMLQRGVFVARARPYIVDAAPAVPLRLARGMEGMCVSYSGANWRDGTSMVGYVRDFSDTLVSQTLPPQPAVIPRMERLP